MVIPNFDEYADLSDAEVEARQLASDGDGTDSTAGEGDEPTPTPAPATGATPAPTAEPTPGATPAPTPQPAADPPAGEDGKVEGVTSKDGSRVLPYGALLAARRDARRAESRAQRLERELAEANQRVADLKSGKTDATEMTEEEVARLEEDFPALGKKARAQIDRLKEIEQRKPQPVVDDEPPDDPVQIIIDAIPQLLDWQHSDAEKFERAQEIDNVLTKSRKWQGKDPAERFREVTRMVCDEYDIEYRDGTKKNAPPPQASPQPAAAPVATPQPTEPPRRTPETLSDFKGGSVPGHASFDWNGSSTAAQLQRMADMSDEEIDEHLRRHG